MFPKASLEQPFFIFRRDSNPVIAIGYDKALISLLVRKIKGRNP